MGSYLRTNYRVTGRELDFTAIGGALGVDQGGSWASGPGTRREFGGFIMGSVDDTHSAGGVVDIDPRLAMSTFYGDAYGTMFGSGYKIFPFVIRHHGTQSNQFFQWSICGSAAGDSGFYIRCFGLSDDGTILTGPSGSAQFVWAGFIVSAP